MQEGPMRSLISLLISVAVLAGLLALGFLGFVLSLGAPESPNVSIEKIHDESGIPVRVVSPAAVEFTDYFYCDGDVVADVRAVVRAKVSEVVEDVYVKVGDKVAKGQPLVEFRRTDIEAEIRAAESAYDEAESNYKRYTELVQQGVVPDDQLEDRRTRLATMAAQLATARSRLAFATLTSPIDGVVEARRVEPGEYKGVGDELITIVDLSTIEVAALVSEQDISDVSVGMMAQFQLEATRDWRTGEVTRISPSTIDPNRLFDVYLTVENTRETGSWLMRPGMYAEVRFQREQPVVKPAIPDSCLSLEGTAQVLYLVEKSTAVREIREPDTRTGLGARLERGFSKLAAMRAGEGENPGSGEGDGGRYETVDVLTARRMVVEVGLKEAGLVELLDDPLGEDAVVIVNPRDDIRNGTRVAIVEAGAIDD
jgi:RND family efflux transporter MFP subunit